MDMSSCPGEGDGPHLRQMLSAYAAYYNEICTHLALGKDAPLSRAVQRTGVIVAIPILSGLHTVMPGYNFRKGQRVRRGVRRPRSPWQNPYVERLIGTVRRECRDRVLVFGEAAQVTHATGMFSNGRQI
jgi:Integrase core domain